MHDEFDEYGGLSPEERLRLGLGVDRPTPPSFESMAREMGADPEELKLLRGVKNRDDYDAALERIATLRELRDEQRRNDLRDEVRRR